MFFDNKNSKNINSLKTFGNKYFREELFKPLPRVIEPIRYGKNDLQLGKRLDGRTYTIDLSEACRVLILGATRCMPFGTLVKTKDCLIEIEKANKVLSYNFKTKEVEEKECMINFSGKQKVLIIKTKYGEIKCSPNHKLYVKRDGEIKEVEAQNIKKTDKLLRVKVNDLEEVEILDIIKTNEEVDMVDLTVKDNHNFILSNNILSLNSGKSWLIRALADRLKLVDRDVIILNDCKDEFKSSLKPVQEKFRHLLLEGETPQPMKIATLRPTFFKNVIKELPSHNFWYSVDTKQLSTSDLFTLLDADSFTSTQKNLLFSIKEEINKMLREDDELDFSLEMFEDIIESNEDLSSIQKTAMKSKLTPIKYSNFFEDEYKKNIIQLFHNGFVPSINMENFDRFKNTLRLPEAFLSIVLREVVFARRKKQIKNLWVFIDEASRFISNRIKNSSFMDLVLESVDLDTRYLVNYCFASQNVDDVPDNILRQCKYLFVPRTADVSSIKSLLISAGIVKNVQIAVNDAMRLKRMMKDHDHSWIVINRMANTKELIIPLAPLSWHMESGE